MTVIEMLQRLAIEIATGPILLEKRLVQVIRGVIHTHGLKHAVCVLLPTLTGGCCYDVCKKAIGGIGVSVDKIRGKVSIIIA
jgi:hypothetical protein